MSARELSFATKEQVFADLDRLLANGYQQTGKWDLSQACQHCAYFINGALDGHQFTVPWLLRFLFGRMVLKRMLSTGKMRSGVPSPQKPPPQQGDDRAEAEKLKHSLDRLFNAPGKLHDSPFFGHLTDEEWRRLMLLHCAHHLFVSQTKSVSPAAQLISTKETCDLFQRARASSSLPIWSVLGAHLRTCPRRRPGQSGDLAEGTCVRLSAILPT